MTGAALRKRLHEAAEYLRVMGDFEAAAMVASAADRMPATDDPSAPCKTCGHILVSHTPPRYECRAVDWYRGEGEPCTCPRFVTS